MGERYNRNPNTKCFVCGLNIYRRPVQLLVSNGRSFCSQACYGISNRKVTPCIVCRTQILAGAHKKTCSRACANKNRAGIKYRIGSPRDKVKDQRSIKLRLMAQRGKKCERCGFEKFEILHVHHKDRNRMHNEMGNLELICPNCHALEHYLENSWLSGNVSD